MEPIVARMRTRLDPMRYASLFDAEFSEDVGVFLPAHLVEAAVQTGVTMRPPESGRKYVAAVLGEALPEIVGDESGQAESAQTTVRACRHSEHLPGEALRLTRAFVLSAQPLELLRVEAHAE